MTLEPKHIVGYLPYGLKVECLDYKRDYVGSRYDTMVGIEQWDKSGERWHVKTKGGAVPAPSRVKPLLYPIESIMDYRNIGGKLISPIEMIYQTEHPKDYIKPDKRNYHFQCSRNFIRVLHRATGRDTKVFIGNYGDNPLWMINIMQELHIDYQGLVPAGIAVDIRAINI